MHSSTLPARSSAPQGDAPAGYVPELDPAHQEPDLVSVVHVVTPGQTLYRISRAYGVSVDEIQRQNRIRSPQSLKAGQTLVLSLATLN